MPSRVPQAPTGDPSDVRPPKYVRRETPPKVDRGYLALLGVTQAEFEDRFHARIAAAHALYEQLKDPNVDPKEKHRLQSVFTYTWGKGLFQCPACWCLPYTCICRRLVRVDPSTSHPHLFFPPPPPTPTPTPGPHTDTDTDTDTPVSSLSGADPKHSHPQPNPRPAPSTVALSSDTVAVCTTPPQNTTTTTTTTSTALSSSSSSTSSAQAVPVPVPPNVVIYMHEHEWGRASNTGSVVAAALGASRARVCLRGLDDDMAYLHQVLSDSTRTVAVLWPGEGARQPEQIRELAARETEGRVTLVALDATWKQARSLHADIRQQYPHIKRVTLPEHVIPKRSLLAPARNYRGDDAVRICTAEVG